MSVEDLLLAALVERFGDQGLRVGTPPGPLAVFTAKHGEVGPLTISRPHIGASSIGHIIDVHVAIGDVLDDHFESFDAHLDTSERAQRLTGNVVRFLQELFADRLLFWQSTEPPLRGGWRERGEAGHTEPLVLDDRTYRVYLWSGPLGEWRASASILARGRIRDDREYQILKMHLDENSTLGGDAAERERMVDLIAAYEDGLHEDE